jgi:ABC-type Na+ efflux pump permease subunit
MKLLGPLFPLELTRVVRRQRPITGRCLYVGLLLVLLGLTYLSLFEHGPQGLSDFLFRPSASPAQLAIFGFTFFMIFIMVQFAVGALTVANSASTILAEEKEKQTLPFLLTTTLSDREIVFGKVGARLAQTLMILLAGLPVLALMQMMGGVDPGLLAAAFIATAVTLISTACVGAAVSVGATSIRQANSITILWIVGYLVLGPTIGSLLARPYGGVVLWKSGLTVTVSDLIDWINAGNFFWIVGRIAEKTRGGGNLDHVLWPALFRYVLFHGLVAAAIITWITQRFRRALARQSDQAIRKVVKTSSTLVARGGRRPVSQTHPVLWRETCTAIGKANQKPLVIWVKRGAFILSFIPVVMVLIEAATYGGHPGGVGQAVYSFVQGVGTAVLCSALMTMANSASNSIARDRRQKTAEELYLTDLSNREILSQKMWAAFWSARWPIIWVALHWAICSAVGGLNPISLVIVWPMFALYSWVAVQVGLAFGVRESPRFKPSGAASFTLLAMAGLPMLLPLLHGFLFSTTGEEVAATGMFALGLSPPAVLGFMTLGSHSTDFTNHEFGRHLPFFITGVAIGIVECVAIGLYARRKMFAFFQGVRRE